VISSSQHATLTTDIHAPTGIRTYNPNRQADADPRLDRAATGTGLLYVAILLGLHSHAAVAEAVGRRSLTTVGQFQFRSCPFEIFDGRTGTGKRFFFCPSNSGFPCQCRATKFSVLIDLRRI